VGAHTPPIKADFPFFNPFIPVEGIQG